ncbi:MAG: hypothetical protein J6D16_05585 [Clostridia bacterium]|nr:hypothetical protein [Clostridia bacterium]
MDFGKIGKALLFPHVALLCVLIPLSAVLLVGSMVFVGTETPIAIVSYVLSAYTLTVLCFRMPRMIRFFKSFREQNKLLIRWQSDTRLRVNVSLYGSLLWNVAYALLQLWLGFYHHTFWFYSLGAYYVCLAVMRSLLLRYSVRHTPGESIRDELIRYRACGWVFLVMNLALTLIVFFMVYWNRTFHHHMITAIAMAAYTFTALGTSILSITKYRKYNSPVFSASKAISLAAASVSMLTLTSTMLTTFGDGTMDALTQKRMLGGVGFAVSGVIVAQAIHMIVQSTKELKRMKNEVPNVKS